jgi:hypothetical protein
VNNAGIGGEPPKADVSQRAVIGRSGWIPAIPMQRAVEAFYLAGKTLVNLTGSSAEAARHTFQSERS